MERSSAVDVEVKPARAMVGFTLTDLALLAVALIWAVNFVVVKLVLGVLSPLAFVGVRMTLAALLMATIYRLSGGDFRLGGREWLQFAGLGLLSCTAYQLLFVHGINLTTAGNSSLIQAAVPVVVAAESQFLGAERLRPAAWLGVGLSFAGIYLVIRGGPNGMDFGASSLYGDLMILAGMTCWATYTVLSRPVLLRHPPDKVTAISTVTGIVPLVAISWPAMAGLDWAGVPWVAWLAILYSGALSICVGYLLWGRAVRKVGSPRTAVYTNLVPVFVVGLAAIFLGEALSWLQLAGGGVILTGIVLTRLRH